MIENLGNATRWSFITQLLSKIITPLINMILARILAPEVFGIIAAITMITSFADMFKESGFSQYLIQRTFKKENELYKFANIAFFVNLSLSFFILVLIFIGRYSLAKMINEPSIGNAIFVASLQLPITSFSAVQLAIYKKRLLFRPIFFSQTIGAIIPLIVTIPLAILGFNYWAIIIGNLFGEIIRTSILLYFSDWKMKLYFNLNKFKEMLSFSIFALGEALSSWLVSWADTFFIGTLFSAYYLGLYKNSISMVNSLIAIITASILPILYSVLSRYKNNKELFNKFFLNFYRFISYFILPIGVGIFLFKDFATFILFGNRWSDASLIVGLWSISTIIRTLFFSIFMEFFRSKGKPQLCIVFQILDFCIMILIFIFGKNLSFWDFAIIRTLSRLVIILPTIYIADKFYDIKLKEIISGVLVPLIGCILMCVIRILIPINDSSYLANLLLIILCGFCYLSFIFIFKWKDIKILIKEFIL